MAKNKENTLNDWEQLEKDLMEFLFQTREMLSENECIAVSELKNKFQKLLDFEEIPATSLLFFTGASFLASLRMVRKRVDDDGKV